MIRSVFYLHVFIFLINACSPKVKETETKIKINSDWAKEQPYVVMISFDGFRYDYAVKYGATNILDFVEQGVTTSSMIPAYPSKTFPNHYTLVTGLYPSSHGIVSNEFYSREKESWYKIGQEAVGDGDWYGGTPLWVLAEQSDMLSASFFWVGSEAKIAGFRPTYMKKYDGSVPNQDRFAQVVKWLGYEDDLRPHFIAVYFSSTDDSGHDFGPNSEEVKKSVLQLDSLFGNFMNQIAEMELPINVVLVADHGMSTIDNGVELSEIVDLSGLKVSKSFPPMIYSDDSSRLAEIENKLNKDGRIDALRPESLPESYHFQKTERIGDLILYTEAPTIIQHYEYKVKGGTHGFDPYRNNEMGAFFGAAGPAINPGMSVSAFDNVHIYPFVAKMLGLKVTQEIDGNLDVLSGALK